jgi:hypothetical protein
MTGSGGVCVWRESCVESGVRRLVLCWCVWQDQASVAVKICSAFNLLHEEI